MCVIAYAESGDGVCVFLKLLGPSPGPQGVGLPTWDTGLERPVDHSLTREFGHCDCGVDRSDRSECNGHALKARGQLGRSVSARHVRSEGFGASVVVGGCGGWWVSRSALRR